MASGVALQVATPPASVDREAKRPCIVESGVVEAVVLKDTAADVVPGIEVVQVENAAVAQHVENVAQPREAQPVAQETEDEVFVGSIDQGTTSSRFIIFNRQGEPVEGHQIEFENLYPESGWHEHDPLELLSSVEECIEQTMRKFSASRPSASVRAVGITNQRETTVVADLQQLCGLPLSTYPSSVKLLWLLRNVEAVSRACEEGRLAFGTVDSWLIYRLNGGAKPPGGRDPVHVTDGTNASRTMFMNLRDMSYDDKLLGFFGIDPAKVQLPRIVPSAHPTSFGQMASGPLAGVRIAGCLGDQSSAVVGQCAFEAGQAKNTYGTGCFLLYNVGPEPVISKSGLLATVAFDFGPELGGRAYALEGSIAVAGSGVKFLQGNLGFAKESAEITALAEGVKDNGGVVFVTAFSGLFAPYWIDDAKGTLFGITQHTQKGHIARATLEATCFQTKAILDAMERDSGHRLGSLAVDGGLSNSDLCMQTQADISGISVDRPAMRETTALGAAIAAGLATGVWSGLGDLAEVGRKNRRLFEPSKAKGDRARFNRMFAKWEQAVEMSRGWVREEHKADEADEDEE
ncbi:hypothetical protein RB595_002484 [Gaeumannomyces hyphopodioides]